MFTPHSLEIALLMMITSAVCWVRGRILTGCEELPLRTFFLGLCDWDFSDFADSGADDGEQGIDDSNSFLNNVHSCGCVEYCFDLDWRGDLNLANLLLVAAIDMAGGGGVSCAIGIALVVGVVSSYALQSRGNVGCCGPGLCGVNRCIMDGKGLWELASAGGRFQQRRALLRALCRRVDGVVGAVVAHAMTKGNTLGPL